MLIHGSYPFNEYSAVTGEKRPMKDIISDIEGGRFPRPLTVDNRSHDTINSSTNSTTSGLERDLVVPHPPSKSQSSCYDLMERMLQVDPKKRITPGEILTHPWITGKTLQRCVDGYDQQYFKRIKGNIADYNSILFYSDYSMIYTFLYPYSCSSTK